MGTIFNCAYITGSKFSSDPFYFTQKYDVTYNTVFSKQI